jgi:hypothetical protein
MTLQKFHSFADAERALWEFNPDENYYRRVRALFAAGRRLCPPQPVRRGITRLRSIDEKNDPLPERSKED